MVSITFQMSLDIMRMLTKSAAELKTLEFSSVPEGWTIPKGYRALVLGGDVYHVTGTETQFYNSRYTLYHNKPAGDATQHLSLFKEGWYPIFLEAGETLTMNAGGGYVRIDLLLLGWPQ